MNDKPSIAFRKKRNSSLIKIIDDLKEGKIEACISSGNTGALMVISTVLMKTIKGEKQKRCQQ